MTEHVTGAGGEPAKKKTSSPKSTTKRTATKRTATKQAATNQVATKRTHKDGSGAFPKNVAQEHMKSIESVDDDEYLKVVMAEIDDEVRARRMSGDLPARVEQELEELFLEHSPVGRRDSGLVDALRMVDTAAFIDPVVPIDSAKSGGAVVKKGLRSMSLWYVGYVTHQVSQFATAVGRALHMIDDELSSLKAQLDDQRVPSAGIVDSPLSVGPDPWWSTRAVEAVTERDGRVLHAAARDGWLIAALLKIGVDAYGLEERHELISLVDTDKVDVREESLVEHLRCVAPGSIGALILTGVVESMSSGERERLLDLAVDALSYDGVIVVHSLTPSTWICEEMAPEADLAPGRPLWAKTWEYLLHRRGFDAKVETGPSSGDYLVVATKTAFGPNTR